MQLNRYVYYVVKRLKANSRIRCVGERLFDDAVQWNMTCINGGGKCLSERVEKG